MATFIFLIAAAFCIAGAVGIVLFRDAIRSVLSLVAVMLALSSLYLMLSAQFIFAVQVIVYSGAVMVLFLFVIALMGPVREQPSTRLRFQGLLAVIVAGSFAGLVVAMLGGVRYHAPDKGARGPQRGRSEMSDITIGSEHLDASWFLILAALLFIIGAIGILVRRNPLVILVCIELMLNAVNLTLVTFSRQLQNSEGQLFALMSITVAAAEAVVGLGILVDIFKDREVEDVDELSELRG